MTRDGMPRVLRARPTTYRGIQMRSRLEATFAGFLDRCGFVWEYEPRAFASEWGQYLPDFVIEGPCGPRPGRVYVDVKGHMEVDGLSALLERMQIILATDPGAMLLVITDSGLSKLTKTVAAYNTDEGLRPLVYQPAAFGLCRCRTTSVLLKHVPYQDWSFTCRSCGDTGYPVALLDPFTRIIP